MSQQYPLLISYLEFLNYAPTSFAENIFQEDARMAVKKGHRLRCERTHVGNDNSRTKHD